MAEYFPLLERAVSGLQDATPGARHAIYERARNALLGQLRAMDPPIPEEDIGRESEALDEAIQRLEAKFRAPEPARPASAPVVAPPPVDSPVRPAAGPAPARASGPPAGQAPPVLTPPRREAAMPEAAAPPETPPRSAAPSREPVAARDAPPPRERPTFPPRRPDADPAQPRAAVTIRPRIGTEPGQARSPLASGSRPAPAPRPGAGTRTGSLAPRVGGTAPRIGAASAPGAAPASPVIEGPAPAVATSEASVQAAEPAPAMPSAAPLDTQVRGTVADSVDAAALERVGPIEPGPAPVDFSRARRPRDGGLRPAAPVPTVPERRGAGFYVALCLAALISAGIAVAAYTLRDRPEQVTAARSTVAPAPATTAPPDLPGKIAGRAEDGRNTTAAGTASEPAARTAQGGQGTAPAGTAPDSSVAPQGTAVQTPTTQAPAAQSPGNTDPAVADTPAIGVAQRAALLVDAPQDPQKVKTYVGTVVWRTESVSPGQDQPLTSAVRADVDIPEAKLSMSMVLKKNTEPQFPASHTLEFHFTPQAGNTLGPIKQINVPEMRRDDSAPTGDSLIGVPVAITENYFLVGLSHGSAETSNLLMLQQRNWVDVSLLFTSGKVGKITFEKGTMGQRIIDDAVKSWQ